MECILILKEVLFLHLLLKKYDWYNYDLIQKRLKVIPKQSFVFVFFSLLRDQYKSSYELFLSFLKLHFVKCHFQT